MVRQFQSDTPLILIPGMGADATIFQHQRTVFANLIIPDWPVPQANDNLERYCQRFAAEVDPGRKCFVGGASFGGVVALELARHLNTHACFLIGSVRNSAELPRRIRAIRFLRAGLDYVPLKLVQQTTSLVASFLPTTLRKHTANLLRQFSSADPQLLAWSLQQLLSWQSSYEEIRALQIHGDRDCLFPISGTHPDAVVSGGGHVLSLTHPSDVNAFLTSHMKKILDDEGRTGTYQVVAVASLTTREERRCASIPNF